MKKIILILVGLLCQIVTHGQGAKKPAAPVSNELKHLLTLQIPREGGANGASVAWHPKQKKYYAAMAGNADYPLAVFNELGKRLSDDKLATTIDTRGLWYNAKTGTLQGNSYNEGGWFEYRLDAAGIPTGKTTILAGMHQPESQSLGVYDNQNNIVYFLSKPESDYRLAIEKYNPVGENVGKTFISFPKESIEGLDEDEIGEEYNKTLAVFTGIPGQEIVLLNVEAKKLEWYNATNGTFVKSMQIPASITPEFSFNFSYANGYYWFFDKANRKWMGCK